MLELKLEPEVGGYAIEDRLKGQGSIRRDGLPSSNNVVDDLKRTAHPPGEFPLAYPACLDLLSQHQTGVMWRVAMPPTGHQGVLP